MYIEARFAPECVHIAFLGAVPLVCCACCRSTHLPSSPRVINLVAGIAHTTGAGFRSACCFVGGGRADILTDECACTSNEHMQCARLQPQSTRPPRPVHACTPSHANASAHMEPAVLQVRSSPQVISHAAGSARQRRATGELAGSSWGAIRHDRQQATGNSGWIARGEMQREGKGKEYMCCSEAHPLWFTGRPRPVPALLPTLRRRTQGG